MERCAEWKRALEVGANWSAADAEAALAAQEKSGESVARFARRQGIVPKRLYWWRYRLADGAKTEREALGRLIPLTVVTAPATATPLTDGRVIVIDGALRIEVEDAEAVSPVWIATLLRTVRETGA